MVVWGCLSCIHESSKKKCHCCRSLMSTFFLKTSYVTLGQFCTKTARTTLCLMRGTSVFSAFSLQGSRVTSSSCRNMCPVRSVQRAYVISPAKSSQSRIGISPCCGILWSLKVLRQAGCRGLPGWRRSRRLSLRLKRGTAFFVDDFACISVSAR